jgi:hypothetical protein
LAGARAALRRSHAAALFGAAAARLRTAPTMLHLVARAFVCARVADVSADLAYEGGELAAARHVRRREPAELSAIDIKRDAARHFLHVLLLQALGGAVAASFRAVVAGLNAGLELFVGHGNSFERDLSKVDQPRTARFPMMNGMMDGMMGLGWLWPLLGLIVVVALVVGVISLFKPTTPGAQPANIVLIILAVIGGVALVGVLGMFFMHGGMMMAMH